MLREGKRGVSLMLREGKRAEVSLMLREGKRGEVA